MYTKSKPIRAQSATPPRYSKQSASNRK